ncbi:MAG: hypothetical protein AABX29_00140 [Nanoarchaeota archaeon]|mgnify:CR=1 FL=1
MKNVYFGLADNGYYLNLGGVRDSISNVVLCKTLNEVLDILSGKGDHHIQEHRKLELIYDKEIAKEDINFIKQNATKRGIKLERVVLDKRYL